MPSFYTATISIPFSFQVPVGNGAVPPLASLRLVASASSLSPLVPVCLSVVQPLWLRTHA